MLKLLQDSDERSRNDHTLKLDTSGCLAATLIPVEETVRVTPFLGRALHYAHQSRSANTLRGYKSDWRQFSVFSEALGIEPMPARPEMVASYLSACADSGLKPGSIQRRVSAIVAMHNAAGYD